MICPGSEEFLEDRGKVEMLVCRHCGLMFEKTPVGFDYGGKTVSADGTKILHSHPGYPDGNSPKAKP